MRIFAAIAISLCVLELGAQTQSSKDQGAIRIVRSGSQPSRQGLTENFTGSVRVDPLFQANAPARASGALVTFESGARTAWHIHPLGQVLIVKAGTGRVQRWGDPVEEIRQGDVVWIPPGQKHWHGARRTVRGLTLRSSNSSTASPWNGWRRSAIRSTASRSALK
jgi:4-carboxymuconolactone decarboxylase